MTVLQTFNPAVFNFTWNHANPNYSTNTFFDPAKLKLGFGSCRIDNNRQNGDFKYVGIVPFSYVTTGETFIVGPGE